MRAPNRWWVLLAGQVALAGVAPVRAAEPDSSLAFSYTASALFYILEDEDDYLVPMFYANRGMLHLEARYQYEDLHTVSLWAGATWSGGEHWWWEATPMAGIVFGDTDGAAPGLEAALGYRALDWYTEAEYLVAFDSSDGDFLYAWSELSVRPREWWRVGLVGQRTRVYESDLEVDRGFLAGAEAGRFTCTVYAFNPDRDAPFLALQAGVDF
jgi:hypothetical protein